LERINREQSRTPTKQQRHIGALAATIGVEFVQNQEPDSLCGSDKLVLAGPSEDQLHHDVICQEDVWWSGDYAGARLFIILAGDRSKVTGPFSAKAVL